MVTEKASSRRREVVLLPEQFTLLIHAGRPSGTEFGFRLCVELPESIVLTEEERVRGWTLLSPDEQRSYRVTINPVTVEVLAITDRDGSSVARVEWHDSRLRVGGLLSLRQQSWLRLAFL